MKNILAATNGINFKKFSQDFQKTFRGQTTEIGTPFKVFSSCTCGINLNGLVLELLH